MSRRRFYITTAIPYVNGDPHLGFALECVQADVLARHRRLRGDDVRFLSGTDDNSLKNAAAADAAGVAVAEFVADKAAAFAGLRAPLQLSYDDFIRTSADPRHRPGVERLWQACASAGDLYQREYEGLYCAGCEAFLATTELVDGRCPEHAAPPERVVERNWFFRLSRYEPAILEALESSRLRIEPAQRRNEVLRFVRGGLQDFSVSRPAERSRGWGIPVPGDPSQVIYVWFDALGNYVTALDYGARAACHDAWWRGSVERVHVIGKGIIRFHAVYWPAILLAAGEPLPSRILVHDYLTVDGSKLSKSAGNALAPVEVAERFGADALRWWFLRDVPRSGDADIRPELVAARANELADELGNLVNRTITLVPRNRDCLRPSGAAPAEGDRLRAALHTAPERIDRALDDFDFRTATAVVWDIVVEANRFVSHTRPWELARAERGGERLDGILRLLLDACGTLETELAPFLPGAADRIGDALRTRDAQLGRRLFRKIPTGA